MIFRKIAKFNPYFYFRKIYKGLDQIIMYPLYKIVHLKSEDKMTMSIMR